ncbi:hypothetical protein EGY31_04185 [Burkholderia multivorans]|uniref:hypothetical protein n=1 Tax=Burkholderia ubonensis TaxID=101571 RepID=UPI000F6B333D|nr:hypothetical protein [Burkholderia ubonensis]AYZ62521.1 hypothetical protein EGY31_04185 [Burkholderia multivorans]VWB53712.1 hypothetical protein BUB20358_02454 [Burkholderia ubonensis]
MPRLVNISAPHAVQVWGFHGLIDDTHVAAALMAIAAKLRGEGHTIHIMSGTHGCCKGMVGAVGRPEPEFAKEDRDLPAPKTGDNKPIAVVVHEFNTAALPAQDPRGEATRRLNVKIREIDGAAPGAGTYLLAYCCSAGEE